MSGKQEPPSGLASQQLSRLPSDEHICLSPPWNEEDDGPVRVGTCIFLGCPYLCELHKMTEVNNSTKIGYNLEVFLNFFINFLTGQKEAVYLFYMERDSARVDGSYNCFTRSYQWCLLEIIHVK